MHDIENDPTRVLVARTGGSRSVATDRATARVSSQPVDEPGPGTIVANTFAIERALGDGGMGSVYLARNLGLGTRHAIKVIRPSLLADPRALPLFHREAMGLRNVRHDAVVAYDGYLRDADGREYLVMDYVEGVALPERIAAGPLSVDEVLSLRDRIAAGLAVAHAKGIIHRDISPDNILLRGGEVAGATLIDFGLTKVSNLGQETVIGSSFAGKFRYASPEQLGLGGEVDPRSDIYSLGLTLATAARGRPLEMGDSFESVIRARQAVPNLAGIPDALRPMLQAMLQPDRERRPESMQALVERWPAQQLGAISRRALAARQTPRWLGWSIAIVSLSALSAVTWVLGPQLASRPAVAPAAVGAGAASSSVVRPGPPTQVAATAPAAGGSARPQRAELAAASPVPGASASGDVGQRIRTLAASGRLLDAFTLTEELIRGGGAPAISDSYALSRQLRDAGYLDQAVALLRWLGNKGSAPAAFDLAEMYDPHHWSPERSAFATPRAATALNWYQRAARLGHQEAEARIATLQAGASSQ